MAERYIITKKIAKQGTNSVIVIPKLLQDKLKPSTLVEIEITIVPEAQNVTKN